MVSQENVIQITYISSIPDDVQVTGEDEALCGFNDQDIEEALKGLGTAHQYLTRFLT